VIRQSGLTLRKEENLNYSQMVRFSKANDGRYEVARTASFDILRTGQGLNWPKILLIRKGSKILDIGAHGERLNHENI
jgi:hypothetical protein